MRKVELEGADGSIRTICPPQKREDFSAFYFDVINIAEESARWSATKFYDGSENVIKRLTREYTEILCGLAGMKLTSNFPYDWKG